MGIPIIIIFACLWYLPLFLKHRKNVKEPAKYYLFAFLLGAVSIVFALLCQVGFGFLIINIPMSATMMKITGFFRILICVAVVEEVAKFLLGRVVLKKVPDLTEAGSMLILGMAGLGFDIAESLTQLDMLSAIVRGVLMLHLFFQLFMGKYWWRAQQARKAGDEAGHKKNIRIALIVPIIVHAIYDYLLFKGIGELEEASELGAVLYAGAIIVGLVYMVYTLVMARKTMKAEALAVTEADVQNDSAVSES